VEDLTQSQEVKVGSEEKKEIPSKKKIKSVK